MTTDGACSGPLIAILDYGIGNLASARKGFARAGADTRLTADRGLIAEAQAVVLPGVGAFGPCMKALGRTGLDETAVAAAEEAAAFGRPFMGICSGLQLLFAGSDESPSEPGLGLFDGRVKLIPGEVKRPQMQWNMLDRRGDHPMFAGLGDQAWVYFAHSYAADDSDDVIATCRYGGDLTAAMARGNLWAVQFHPEKSSSAGLRILANFVASLGNGSDQPAAGIGSGSQAGSEPPAGSESGLGKPDGSDSAAGIGS